MDKVDVAVLRAIGGGLPVDELEVTARTLRAIRERFEQGARWRRAPARGGLPAEP